MVWLFRSALLLVLSAANLILRDPLHYIFSIPVSDDISEAHTDVQHLNWVHELQFSRNVESILIFSHNIFVYNAYQEFSSFYHLAKEVEFSLQLAMYLFCLMLIKRSSTSFGILDLLKSFCNTVRDPTECNVDGVAQPQKVYTARFECISSSLSNCFDFLISAAVFECSGN